MFGFVFSAAQLVLRLLLHSWFWLVLCLELHSFVSSAAQLVLVSFVSCAAQFCVFCCTAGFVFCCRVFLFVCFIVFFLFCFLVFCCMVSFYPVIQVSFCLPIFCISSPFYVSPVCTSLSCFALPCVSVCMGLLLWWCVWVFLNFFNSPLLLFFFFFWGGEGELYWNLLNLLWLVFWSGTGLWDDHPRVYVSDKKAFFVINTSDTGPQIYELVAQTQDARKT